MNIAENRLLNYALRALQLIFAIIVLGTDGYAIHVFRGHTVDEHFEFGNFYDYYGVPSAWGFLIFCAVWTFVTVIFQLTAKSYFAGRAWAGWLRIAVEAVAALSWLAGFIAVAVSIPTNSCSTGTNSCGSLKAATAFGAFEWLLFLVSVALTYRLVLNGSGKPGTSTTRLGAI